MRVDETGRVVGFLEKPQTDEDIELVRMDPAWIDAQGIDSDGRDCLASMGIYVFNRDFLVDVLRKTSYRGFWQGGLSGRLPQPARAGAPVRRLLGRHRDHSRVLRSES